MVERQRLVGKWMGIEAVDAQGKGIPQPSSHVKFFSLVGGGDDGTVHA
jgi:hypothetical protein